MARQPGCCPCPIRDTHFERHVDYEYTNACQRETFISQPSACREAPNNTCHPMQPCLKHITRFRNAASAHQKGLHKAYSIVAPAASERVIVPCKGNGSISLE
jgi:hypothetical protein